MLIAGMTMPEFAEGLEKTRTLLLPFGATEEHGDHLPLATDTIIAETVGLRLAERRPVFIAPAVPYGVCRSTGQHPGTVSLTTPTLRALAIDLVEAFYAQGLRNFILLSGHAGGTHNATLIDAGELLLRRFDDICIAVVTEYDLVAAEAAFLIETPGDSHAGEIETSRLLHSHPGQVRGPGKREFPAFPRGVLVRDKRKYWPGGVWGDPTKATAEKGRQLEELVVDALDKLVDELEKP